MTKPTKKTAQPEQQRLARKAIEVRGGKTSADTARNTVATAIAPETAAARILQTAESGGPFANSLDTPSMMAELKAQAAAVNGGDLSHAEAMLMNQATALQTLFMRLTERGLEQSHMPNLEAFMRLALRAQAQCRATLETLAAIKNPPVIYARQANVTTGPQQVNNGVAAQVAPVHAAGTESPQGKLLEGEAHGEWLDTRATGTAGGANQELAAVGAQHRAEDGGGQGNGGAEQLPGRDT